MAATKQLTLSIPDAPEFAGKVVEIVQSTFHPQDNPPTAAAAALDALFREDYTSHGEAGSFLWWFWDLFHDIAGQVPYRSHEQDQLIAVVGALQSLPSNKVDLGESWGRDAQAESWTTLPMFANTFREKLDGNPFSSPESTAHRINLESYAARVAGLAHLPFETYAIWALVDALEGTMTPVRGAPDTVNDDPTAIQHIAAKVEIASAWIVYTGRQLYGRDEVVSGATAGPLWKLDKKEARAVGRRFRGTDGLCPERWKLWKDRFSVIRNASGLSADTRQHAADAHASMETAEKSQAK